MNNLWYLFIAFAVAWLVILGYLMLLSRHQSQIESDMRHLDEEMQSQGKGR